MRWLYLHGFASGSSSKKAAFFQDRFAAVGLTLEIPDLTAGDFEHLTLSGQLRVIESELKGEAACLVGSSMGGYLAALYAARHPEIECVVLLAPAFGFARRWPLRLGEDVTRQWRETGWMTLFHYGRNQEARIHYGLLEDGLRYEDYPAVAQPALVFHGTRDDVVPSEFSAEFRRRNPRAEVHFLDSGHELTDCLDGMWTRMEAFLGLSHR
ncbi:MAG: alpha/beta hydrolase [Bryobacteraceae bacterium]